jgi:peptide/nickel transport system permease protein
VNTVATQDDLAVAPLQIEEAELVSGRDAGLELWLGVVTIALAMVATLAVRVGGLGQPNQVDLVHTLAPPSLQEPFGTDALGRSVFLRTVYATGLDLWVGVVTTLIPLVIGMIIGVISGYFGGWGDAVLMRIMDAFLAFPFIVLIIGFVAVFGAGLTGALVGLTVASVPIFARVTRGEMLILREQQFILAARTLGYSPARIVFRHAMPHLLRPNIVIVPSVILGNVLTLAALSFLGLGVQPPTPEWGAIIANGQTYLFSAWWISTLPGLFVVVVGIGFSLAGEGLIDRFHLRKA